MRLWSDLRREWILSTAPSPATGTAAQNTYFHRISTGFPPRISMVFHRIFKLFSPLIRQTEIFWRAAVRSPNREIYCVGLIIGTKNRNQPLEAQTLTLPPHPHRNKNTKNYLFVVLIRSLFLLFEINQHSIFCSAFKIYWHVHCNQDTRFLFECPKPFGWYYEREEFKYFNGKYPSQSFAVSKSQYLEGGWIWQRWGVN